jgi:hypothetical protein
VERKPEKPSAQRMAVKAVTNHSQNTARWHKHVPARHAAKKPGISYAALTAKVKPSPKKPSPAISKGQSR